jgi:hypothetical protein
MARIATRWPTDEFDTRIEGVPVLTTAGVDVPDEHLAAVKDLALLSGVGLHEFTTEETPTPTAQVITTEETPPASGTPAPSTSEV